MRSNLVVVPALVRTKSGELVYTLKANDFILTDNGVVQKLRLEEDTGTQPLAMVIIAQTGGDAAVHLDQYQNLGPMLDNMLGGIEHRVAVVGFDSTPILLHGFTPNLDYIAHSLDILDPGDKHAAVLDAIVYAVNLLRQQPTTYRRAILLLSQTTDDGSHTSLVDALHAISDTNTVIYSVGFHTTGTRVEKGSRRSSAPIRPARSMAASAATSAPTPTASPSSPPRAPARKTSTASRSSFPRCAWPTWPRSPHATRFATTSPSRSPISPAANPSISRT